MSEMLSMGGYGVYVWTAYAATFAVLVLCALQALRRHRRIVRELRTRLKATETGS